MRCTGELVHGMCGDSEIVDSVLIADTRCFSRNRFESKQRAGLFFKAYTSFQIPVHYALGSRAC